MFWGTYLKIRDVSIDFFNRRVQLTWSNDQSRRDLLFSEVILSVG